MVMHPHDPDRFDRGRLPSPRSFPPVSPRSARQLPARARPLPAEHGPARPLVQTERGMIRRCTCCGGLELRFGNAILGLATEDLGAVHSALVEAELAAGDGARSGDHDQVVLWLGNNTSGWVFDRSEAAELRRLLVRACVLLDQES